MSSLAGGAPTWEIAIVGGGGAGGVGITSEGGPSSRLQPAVKNATTITFTIKGNTVPESFIRMTIKYLKMKLSSRPFFTY
jgi:hypothetical protein